MATSTERPRLSSVSLVRGPTHGGKHFAVWVEAQDQIPARMRLRKTDDGKDEHDIVADHSNIWLRPRSVVERL